MEIKIYLWYFIWKGLKPQQSVIYKLCTGKSEWTDENLSTEFLVTIWNFTMTSASDDRVSILLILLFYKSPPVSDIHLFIVTDSKAPLKRKHGWHIPYTQECYQFTRYKITREAILTNFAILAVALTNFEHILHVISTHNIPIRQSHPDSDGRHRRGRFRLHTRCLIDTQYHSHHKYLLKSEVLYFILWY